MVGAGNIRAKITLECLESIEQGACGVRSVLPPTHSVAPV
jgi:hypothetical protein